MVTTRTLKKTFFIIPHITHTVLKQLQLILLGSLLLGLVMGTVRPELSLVTFFGSFMILLCVAIGGAYLQYSQRWNILQRHLARRR